MVKLELKPCGIPFPEIDDKVVGERIVMDKNGNRTLEKITFREIIPQCSSPYRKKIDVYDMLNLVLDVKERELDEILTEGSSDKLDYENARLVIESYKKAIQLMRDTYFD